MELLVSQPGRDGITGSPGQNGAPGQPGRDGTAGSPGQNGASGQPPGRDGITSSPGQNGATGQPAEVTFIRYGSFSCPSTRKFHDGYVVGLANSGSQTLQCSPLPNQINPEAVTLESGPN
ncbi:hypothetical protein EB796_007572 [Bugula neritina]|uniref:Uncharacterized protein n=1 Tax=Bugula neritina TaxID=10212 RepID=A0A7J7K7E2_BUGNE|nr:hypothetical protein EB796_007572 [Bugula neritina]